MKQISKTKQIMLSTLSSLPGSTPDTDNPSATIKTMHRAGRLVWYVHWTMEIRDNRKQGDKRAKFQYRLEINPGFKVTKTSAKLDFTTVPADKLELAKRHIEFLRLSGPFMKGASARNMQEFENGKEFLWKQIQNIQKYYSTIKKLTWEQFEAALDDSFPPRYKELIQAQK